VAVGARDSAALRAGARTDPLVLPLLPNIILYAHKLTESKYYYYYYSIFHDRLRRRRHNDIKGALSSRQHIMIMARALKVFSRFMQA